MSHGTETTNASALELTDEEKEKLMKLLNHPDIDKILEKEYKSQEK